MFIYTNLRDSVVQSPQYYNMKDIAFQSDKLLICEKVSDK